MAKEGARHHGGATTRCWPSPPAPETDIVPAARGPGQHPDHLGETVGRVRYAGANGRLTLRADSGFYRRGIRQCRKMDVLLLHHHPPAQKPAGTRRDAWTPIPY